MLARWSLRSRLVAVVTLALVPVLALSAWHAAAEARRSERHRIETVIATADLAVARHRAFIEGSRRLLLTMCADDAVRSSAGANPTAGDLGACSTFMGSVLQMFGDEYSHALVTDSRGVARCSSLPSAIGLEFADREVYRLVRDSRKFVIGTQVASRLVPRTVLPAALPLLEGGEFRGMCAIDISVRSLSDMVTSVAGNGVVVALVDRAGAAIGGDPQAARILPGPTRMAANIVGGRMAFRDYGDNGRLYEFRVRPLADTTIFVVAAAPLAEGLTSLVDDWGGFALVTLALAAALLAVWLGADRWCVQPLRHIREFADRVARGDDLKLEPNRRWGPELSSVGEGVKAMAAAIATREAELRAGLEQRDHMLREIHHRVKNNLQMISSLLNLQAGEIRSPRIRRFFGDAQNRVLTLSILHRHLYERSSWALVDFQQFISDLVRQISVGRRGPDRPQPRYHIRAPIMAVGPDIAIPIGLIVTEAVSSALNRSFAGTTPPEIRIEAADKAGMIEITIEDNAAGTGGSLGPDARGGFGVTLIRGLAMQLGGEAVISSREGGGLRVAVTFPMPEDVEGNA